MVSTSITPEAMTLVDRPGALHKLAAILLPLCGLAVAAWIAYQMLVPPTASVDCSRPRGTCELKVGSRERSVKIAELTGARVSEHRVSKLGTLHQLDLVLGVGIADVGKPTSSSETTAELHAAAAAITAFLASTQPTLTVSWVQRVGFPEMLRLALTGGTLLLLGVIMLGMWVRRTIVVDRLGRKVRLERSGPLRSRRTREVSLDDVRELRERNDRDRSTIELVLGDRDVWPAITREPSNRPALVAARGQLEQVFGRALSKG